MNARSVSGINQIIFSVVFVAAVFLAYLIIIYSDSQMLLLIGVAFLAVIIVFRPIIGLASYLVMYPMVPAEEAVTSLKIVVFGLIVLLFVIWVMKSALRKESVFKKPEYRWMFIFFLFVCFSPLLGTVNNFSTVDSARDIAPLLNLLLIPIMVDSFSKAQNRWLLYLIFVPIGLGIWRDILVLLGHYGVFFESLSFIASLPIPSIHPSLGFALGLIMYLYKAPRRHLWLILSAMSLMVAFLTPTRTVWITTVTMGFLIIAFGSRRRIVTIISIIILASAVGWLVFHETDSATYVESQKIRYQGLIEYQHNLSYQNRIAEIRQTKELFLSSPLYGVGFGYNYEFWRPFIVGIGKGVLSSNFTHNDIMFIASKGGIIGLLLFGLMLYGFAKKLYQRRKEKPKSVQSASATFALLMIVNSLVIGLSTPVYQTRWATFALAILLAFGLSHKESGYDAREITKITG